MFIETVTLRFRFTAKTLENIINKLLNIQTVTLRFRLTAKTLDNSINQLTNVENVKSEAPFLFSLPNQALIFREEPLRLIVLLDILYYVSAMCDKSFTPISIILIFKFFIVIFFFISYPEWPHRQGGCLACCGCTFESR